MGAIYLSAAHKSSGKTTVSIGICAALARRGFEVQPFKKGPDYIDPMWLGRSAGHPCYNLDFYTQSHGEITRQFLEAQQGADIAVIEGNKGLYDGLDLEGTNSNAALAKLLGTPVVLVLDVRGTIRGVAPLLLGYQQFDPEVVMGGVILNRVGGPRHERKLREVIAHYTDIPVLGAIHNNPDMAILERHLGLVPSNEASEVQGAIEAIANAIEQQVDLEALAQLATQQERLAPTTPPELQALGPLRIGIAQDAAFGFYYPRDLEQLQAAGATLVPVDMLHDKALPADLDGLFIGGGFPETQMAELSANQGMRESVREAIEADLPVYAECGGLMYLAERIQWQEESYPMVGIIPGQVKMHPKPVGKGYIQLEELADSPWPGRSETAGPIYGHEFHYSSLEGMPKEARYAFRVKRGFGITGSKDGYLYRNLLACYAHLRDVDAHRWTQRFLNFVAQVARERAADTVA